MKKSSAFLLACALLNPAALLAANFGGKVRFTITTGKNTQDVDYKVKDGLARIDVQTKDATASVIMAPAKQEVTILMHEQKIYMVQSIAGKGVAANAGADPAGARFGKTAVTEKILGCDCTKYIATNKESTSEIWATEALGPFAGFGPGAGFLSLPGATGAGNGGSPSPAGHPAGTAAFAGQNFFPLRLITTNAKGQETFRLDAISIEEKSLPDSDFTPPADFKKIDMSTTMRGVIPAR